MKKFIPLLFIAVMLIKSSFAQDIYLEQNFENGGSKPENWTYQYVSGSTNWVYQNGGYTPSGNPGTGHPGTAKQGVYNAILWYEVFATNKITKLVSSSFDLSYAIKPELKFWHAQAERDGFSGLTNDELKVFCKDPETSLWVLLDKYTVAIEDWVEQSLIIPDSLFSSNTQIAFEGIATGGFGVCIDSVTIIETGIIPKYLESLEIKQASTEIVPTESSDNPILRIDFSVKGNDGQIILDSLAVNSLNTNDSDIRSPGVKIYASTDTLIANSKQIGTTQNFSNGVAIFDNINHELRRGYSSVWIMYDINEDTDHSMEDNILDAKIKSNSIKINNYTYPFVDKSPEGYRTITESIFFDDFENDNGWTFIGEFERDSAQGLGGNLQGNPNPSTAYSGQYTIGTDITGLGDVIGGYEKNITNRAYQAVSPNIDCKYYKNIKMIFWRWLNTEPLDTALIDISIDDKNNWQNIWQNKTLILENDWNKNTINVSEYFNDQSNTSVRFAMGGTSNSDQLTGWNIDNFIITGNFLTDDVGIIDILAPNTGCGHSVSDTVTVVIKNYAGLPTNDTIPVYISFDGGTSRQYDTIFTSLPINGIDTITLSRTVDLTTPGEYNMLVSTALPNDEVSDNDSHTHTFYAVPTYTLPYSQNFETNNGHWRSLGLGNWGYGKPTTGDINNAASGLYAWVTHLNDDYSNSDSSILESPCFDFTDINNPVFEFKLKNYTKANDGMALFYSLDNGLNWDIVPETSEYYWKWYNESLIEALGTAGWGDTTTTDWYTVRKLLPAVIANESSVKFRFLFKSNTDELVDAGIGIDDIKIHDTPYDVGVRSLIYPYNRCEWNDTTHVKVYIKNYGMNDVKAGTNIPLVLNFNSEITKDTLTLASDLIIEDSVLFIFNSTVDMSFAGAFDFIINTNLESNTYFYNDTVSNDTLYETVTVQGMPNYDIGWIIGSDNLDTLLDATAGYASYLWYFGGAEVSTNQTYRTAAAGIYYVTVTNAIGCTANDSLKVVQSTIDVKMDSIRTELKDSCERFDSTEIIAAISNSGIGLSAGDSIPFGYQINNLPVVYDTLILADTLSPTDTVTFTFAKKCDLTEAGEYAISVFTNFLEDLNRTDDTITTTINTWGLPEVNLAYDTIYSSQADTLTLDAGSGFASYLWSPGDSTTQTITPTNSSYYYYVTVTDVNGCGSDKDSTYIETHDLGISAVNYPVDTCGNDVLAPANINVDLTNYSANTYTSTETVDIFYNYDNTGWVKVTPQLGTNLLANDTISLNIANIDISTPKNHTLKIYSSSDIDANHNNDTLEYSFETWPLPHVELAYDIIFTTKADTVQLIATPGYASYSWSDGSNNDTLIVSKKYSQKYVVTVTDEHGCGSDKDSTQIITYNIGVMQLNSPTSSCTHTTTEPVKITVKNYSQDTIRSGESIDLYYVLNGNTPVKETEILTSDLLPSKTFTHQFTPTVNLSAEQTYVFDVYTDYNKDVYRANDTLTEGVRTYGNPTIELGDDILTSQPDTVFLVAPAGYNNYTWNDGSKNDTLDVYYLASKLYSVTVTDMNGCSANDQINIYTYDVAASNLVSPFSQCVLSATEDVNIDVVNNSSDTLLIGETIDVSYILNSGSLVSESFNLADTLFPTETVNHTFAQQANLSANQVHELKVFAKLSSIDVELDDTITSNIDYQKPAFDLGADVNTGSSQYTIDAGAGYTSYLWFDASTNQTYVVDINDQNPNYYYAVTVTNSYGCSADDSIQVTFTTTPDLEVTSMITPVSDCWNETETYPVHIVITNSGVVNLNPGTSFTVGYKIDGGTAVTETYNLSAAMNASDTREHTFANEISFATAKVYEFKTFVKHADDGDVSNDTLTTNIDISAPVVDLGPDTIYFTDTYEITPSENYSSYLWSDESTGSTLVVSETGHYSVTVTDANGCQGEGSIYCEKLPVGIDNIIQGDGYKITYYPNPVSEKLMIRFDNKKSTDVIIEIISLNGQVLYNNKLSDIENAIEKIDVNPYANGVYYLRFRINQDFYIRKLIIQ